jgi:hypothetical protein
MSVRAHRFFEGFGIELGRIKNNIFDGLDAGATIDGRDIPQFYLLGSSSFR